jgi:hypothetical protein
MFNWLQEYLSIRYQFKRQKLEMQENALICKSCETLKMQLEIANYERKQMLDALIKPSQPQPVTESAPPQSIRPHSIPWAVRKQMLEAEDRKKFQVIEEQRRNDEALAKAAVAKAVPRGESGGLSVVIPDVSTEDSIKALEDELGIEEAK